MTFSNEDGLAIHTVAAASYGILHALLKSRNRHDLEDLLRAGVYNFARSLACGEISDAEIDDLKRLEVYRLVLIVSEDIKIRGDEVTPNDVQISMSDADKVHDWK